MAEIELPFRLIQQQHCEKKIVMMMLQMDYFVHCTKKNDSFIQNYCYYVYSIHPFSLERVIQKMGFA